MDEPPQSSPNDIKYGGAAAIAIAAPASTHVFASAESDCPDGVRTNEEGLREKKHLVVPASLQSDRRRIPRVPDARGKLLFSLSLSLFLPLLTRSPPSKFYLTTSLPDFIFR